MNELTDPLDDLALWRIHTNSDANAERALGKYRELKERYPDDNGNLDLNLGGCGLTALPSEIGALTSITHLLLPYNQLTTLPPEIGKLTSLIGLWCSRNQLTTLPPEISKLTSLKEFSCSNNQLTTLPLEIGALTSIILFWRLGNPFAEGEPTTIEELQERWRTHQMRRIKPARAL